MPNQNFLVDRATISLSDMIGGFYEYNIQKEEWIPVASDENLKRIMGMKNEYPVEFCAGCSIECCAGCSIGQSAFFFNGDYIYQIKLDLQSIIRSLSLNIVLSYVHCQLYRTYFKIKDMKCLY